MYMQKEGGAIFVALGVKETRTIYSPLIHDRLADTLKLTPFHVVTNQCMRMGNIA